MLKSTLGIILCGAFMSLGPTLALGAVTSWGVNGPAASRDELKVTFGMLQMRGLTQYRVNVNLTVDTDAHEVKTYRDMAELAKTYQIKLKPILFTSFAYGDRTDAGKYPAGDAAALYAQGYKRTYDFVSQFKDEIEDWEMGNEINLLARDAKNNPLFGEGWSAQEFNLPLMKDWATVLRGMSDAIGQINQESGRHLRRTLNTTSTMFGFLDFMTSQGVAFEVISYHYYEHLGVDPHNYWGGPGRPAFDLFKKLASYKRHVVFNEVNCAEIYDKDYENEAGKPLTEACYRNLDSMLTQMNTQTDVVLESVDLYELLDEAAKAVPENRFGLLYDLKRPKLSFYILSHFAHGVLSPVERNELVKRGLAH